jgi:uncharacterized membrane protein YkvI
MDMLTGIHRYFPSTMITGLIVLGLTLGRVSWVLVGVGGIILTILIMIMQVIVGRFAPTEQTPGLIEACSVLPLSGSTYFMVPSFWFTITTFFLSYIMSNAVSVYTKNPTKQPNTAIAVQQRKGLGVISIVAVLVIGLILLGARMLSPCESWVGSISSILLGGGLGYAWWYALSKQGNDIFQDIHGVMVGLQPGDLRTGPVACTPA